MSEKISIMIVDDHTLIRDAIRNYFDEDDQVEVVAEAINGKDALMQLEKSRPDVILTDISMPVIDGQELVKQVKEKHNDQKMIALTMINETQQIKSMINLGIDGYVLKNCDQAELKTGIAKVMKDEKYFSAQVLQKITEDISNAGRSDKTVVEMPLSDREKEVLQLILEEHSNSEIANKLFISVRTVNAHKRNLLEKTGAKNMVGLVIYALEKGIITR